MFWKDAYIVESLRVTNFAHSVMAYITFSQVFAIVFMLLVLVDSMQMWHNTTVGNQTAISV